VELPSLHKKRLKIFLESSKVQTLVSQGKKVAIAIKDNVQRAATRKAEKEEEKRRIKTLLNYVTYFVAFHQMPNPCFSHLISLLLHLICARIDNDDEEAKELQRPFSPTKGT
jgi:hypothetical protein